MVAVLSNTSPRISIIIAAFNAVDYLRACLDSLQPNSNPDVEIILVDDGSNDGTEELVDLLSSTFANVFAVHKQNGGSSSARNCGLLRARGDWIWLVDADDIVSPYAFEAWRKAISETEDELICSPVLFFDSRSSLSWKTGHQSYQRISGMDYLYGAYRGEYHHFNWQFLYNKQLLKRCASRLGVSLGSLYREDIVLYEDVLFCETLLREAQGVTILSRSVYACRRNPFSVTNKRNNANAESGLRAVRLLDEYEVPLNILPDKRRMEISLLFSVYKLIENDRESISLKMSVRNEIESRCNSIGLSNLGRGRAIRYLLLKTGLLDCILCARSIR